MSHPGVPSLNVRSASSPDRARIRQLIAEAFPTDAESTLVDRLYDGDFVRVSLVADVGVRIVGQILFSGLVVETAWGSLSALALAPLCVHPEYQRRGIGSELLRRGLDHCRDAGHAIVFVLGDPKFYGRFGFSHALAARFDCRYQCPAFQTLELEEGALEGIAGRVVYPAPFSWL